MNSSLFFPDSESVLPTAAVKQFVCTLLVFGTSVYSVCLTVVWPFLSSLF